VPSRNTRRHEQSFRIKRDFFRKFADERFALGPWTDQTHVAAEHIEELRDLVDAELAQPFTNTRDAWIIFNGPHRAGTTFCIRAHGAKLVNDERNALAPSRSCGKRSGPVSPILPGSPHGRRQRRDQQADGRNEDIR